MFHEVSKQTRMNQKKTYGGRFMRQNNNGRLYGSDAMHFPAGIEHRFI